jgi:hypothetical protein
MRIGIEGIPNIDAQRMLRVALLRVCSLGVRASVRGASPLDGQKGCEKSGTGRACDNTGPESEDKT